jgi:hypothetical protein
MIDKVTEDAKKHGSTDFSRIKFLSILTELTQKNNVGVKKLAQQYYNLSEKVTLKLNGIFIMRRQQHLNPYLTLNTAIKYEALNTQQTMQ